MKTKGMYRNYILALTKQRDVMVRFQFQRSVKCREPSLPLLSSLLKLGVEVPVKVSSMEQIHRFEKGNTHTEKIFPYGLSSE